MSKKYAISKYWRYLLFIFLVITIWSSWFCELLGDTGKAACFSCTGLPGELSHFERGIAWKNQYPHSLTLLFQKQITSNLPFSPPDLPSSHSLCPETYICYTYRSPSPLASGLVRLTQSPLGNQRMKSEGTDLFLWLSYWAVASGWDCSQKVTLKEFYSKHFSLLPGF